MPVYGDIAAGVGAVGQIPAALAPGDSLTLFNAETPAAGTASIAFARALSPSGSDQGVTFSMHFAAAPTSSLLIQGSNVDVDAQYQTLATSTNKQDDVYTDTGRWRFYRAKLATQSAGGALTVIAQR